MWLFPVSLLCCLCSACLPAAETERRPSAGLALEEAWRSYDLGLYAEAGRQAERAAALDPAWEEPLLLLGRLAYWQAEYHGAAERFRLAVSLEPASAESRLWLARSLRALAMSTATPGPAVSGDKLAVPPAREARRLLQELARLCPGYLACWRLLASLATDDQDYGLAAYYLEQAINQGAELGLVYLDRARLAMQSGDRMAAREDLATARLLLPPGGPGRSLVDAALAALEEGEHGTNGR